MKTAAIIECAVLFEGADLINVLSAHFTTLPDVLKELGIDINSLVMIGRGDKGTAFSDGKVVVKVTEDKREANASANLLGKTVPGVAAIHFVGKFPKEIPYQEETDDEPIDTAYYLIVQDLVDTKALKQMERTVADIFGSFLSDNQRLAMPLDTEQLPRFVYNYAYKKFNTNITSPKNTEMIKELGIILNNLYRNKITFRDVSAANLGKDANGKLVAFDLGISDSKPVQIQVIT